MYLDDIELAGKKQNLDPMWKILMKDVDLGEPTSFLDRVYLGCTQRKCQKKQRYCGQLQKMFESRISAGAKERQSCAVKLDAKISSWSYDMEGHAKKCVESCCELANKKPNSFTKSQQFKEEEMGSVGEKCQ